MRKFYALLGIFFALLFSCQSAMASGLFGQEKGFDVIPTDSPPQAITFQFQARADKRLKDYHRSLHSLRYLSCYGLFPQYDDRAFRAKSLHCQNTRYLYQNRANFKIRRS